MENKKKFMSMPAEGLWHAVKVRPVDTNRPLPTPTQDVAALKADLDVHGYCLIANALSPDQVKALRERSNEQMDAEEEAGIGLRLETGARASSNLLNKGRIFVDVVTHDLVDEIVEHVVGEGFQLGNLSVIQTVPGSREQGLHFDQDRVGFHSPISLLVNCVFMLDDFTHENGATRVVPGSHLWSVEQIEEIHSGPFTREINPEIEKRLIDAEGPAGTCVVLDGRLIHAGGANTTERTRIGLFAYYNRGWVRPNLNPQFSISDDVMMSLPERVRERLGYASWNAFGCYESVGAPIPLDRVRPTNQTRAMYREKFAEPAQ